ncbi:MAG: hypothetical protein V1865_03110, partial [bacterium]
MKINNRTTNSIIASLAVVIVIGLLFVFNTAIAAWTSPTSAPPGNNEPKPINISPDNQSKEGAVILNTGNTAEKGLVLMNGDLDLKDGNLLLNSNEIRFGDLVLDDFVSFKAATNTSGIHRWSLPPTTGDVGDALMIQSIPSSGNAILRWGSPTEGVESDGDWVFELDKPEMYTTYFARVGRDQAGVNLPRNEGNFYVQHSLEVDGDLWARNPNNASQKASFNNVDIYGTAKVTGFTTAGFVRNDGTGTLFSSQIVDISNDTNLSADNGLNLAGDTMKLGGNLAEDTGINIDSKNLIFNLGDTGSFNITGEGSNIFTMVKDIVNSVYAAVFNADVTFNDKAKFNDQVWLGNTVHDSFDNAGNDGDVLTSVLRDGTWMATEWVDPQDMFNTSDNDWYFGTENDIYSTYFARVGSGGTMDSVSNPGDLYVQNNLEVDGASWLNSLRLSGTVKDRNNSAGSDGYLLKSTADGVEWMDPSSLAAETYWQYDAGTIYSTYFTRVGDGGTINYANGPGDLYVQSDLEVDNNLYVAGQILAKDGDSNSPAMAFTSSPNTGFFKN